MEISRIARNVAFRINSLPAGALVSVIVLSLLGAGASIGLIQYAESKKSADAVSGGPAAGSKAGACYRCGTVESVRVVMLRGDASGLGAVAGGAAAAATGSQSDRGRGNPAMTDPGAAGGAFPGNEIAHDPKKRLAYRVTVHMDDGSYRTVSQPTPPGVATGDKVRLVGNSLIGE
ncbi:MAG: hypothetical protein A3H32_13205 [Betaproteobacteria bacterium RIFCSPLOWO2_02_FULL_63_19]|nr:MAG: hypothetical protein A3H32_13205 [Betaproteobacteria bacterium RIFCSPLOWO2_02_FULL_63_19]